MKGAIKCKREKMKRKGIERVKPEWWMIKIIDSKNRSWQREFNRSAALQWAFVLHYTWISNTARKQRSCTFCSNPSSLCPLFCLRCIPSALLYSPSPYRHPLVLPGAGSGSEDQAWQHRGVELRLPTAGRHRSFQSDGECQLPIRKSHWRNSIIRHT